MSDTNQRMKYEDAFGSKDPNSSLKILPYNSIPDPYERADDQALRFKWLQDAQILSGPFRPSGRVKGMAGQASSELPSRSTLPAMVAELREAIEKDWAEYPFLVCSTDDEHLVVRFELSTLDSEPGLGAYMNFSRNEHVVSKFSLKKVVEDWNVTPGDGHLYFTFRPPWVTSRITDVLRAAPGAADLPGQSLPARRRRERERGGRHGRQLDWRHGGFDAREQRGGRHRRRLSTADGVRATCATARAGDSTVRFVARAA